MRFCTVRQIYFYTLIACFACLSGIRAISAQETGNVEGDSASITVFISDREANPVVGASVEVRLWGAGRQWVETEFKGKSDDDGLIAFKGLSTDNYLTLLVKHPKFASVMQDFSVAAGEQRSVTCKLLSPVRSWFQVVTAEGKPLVGARVSRLTVSSPESELKMTLSDKVFPMMAEGTFESDQSGRLELPPLPAGSVVTVKVVHPQWANQTTSEQDLVDGELMTVMLSKGTRVHAKLHGDVKTVSELEGKTTFLHASSRTDGVEGIIHQFPVVNGAVDFCLQPGPYDQISLSIDGVQITPQIPGTMFEFDFLKFDTDRMEKNFVVRKKHKVRGRVLTSEGKPVVKATVLADTRNLFVDVSGEQKAIQKLEYVTADIAETDDEGFYTVKIPKGQTKIHVAWSGYYSDPFYMETDFDNQGSLPDYVVHPMPVVKGVVVDENGKPVQDAIVRLRGKRPGTDYDLTDNKGNFSIALEYSDYDQETLKLKFEKELVAFDPRSNLAQNAKINLKDAEVFENVRLELKPRSSDWVLDLIPGEFDIPESYKKTYEATIQSFRKKYAAGLEGKEVPDLSEGTWFNTDAKSLEDFRGKYVLLDFWFIGCGPCIRDMPTIKKAQDLFGEQGFTVVSVHISGQTPENVKQFADAHGMTYPLVVDNASDEILNQYEKLGVFAFPSYLLIGPDGKIVTNDMVSDPPSLRQYKLEVIHRELQNRRNN